MKLLFVLASLFSTFLVGWSQTTTEPQPSANNSLSAALDAVGTEFTVFFQENAARRPDFTFELQLFLTTHSSTPVTVRLQLPLVNTASASTLKEVIVVKGNVTEVNFPQDQMHIGSSRSNKGIHILADAPIIVYGVNPQRFSSEGFIAIPNHLLGTEYYAVGMPAEDQHSQLGAVAVESGETEITVTLPNNAELKVDFEGRSYSANDVIVTRLNQYQTLQLQHRNRRRGRPDGDLSGARIQCSKRCAAFSGNSRTSVSGDSRDLLVEQLPPVSTWGKEFAVPPTPERTDRPDVLKIVCQQDGTTVLVDGVPDSCDAGGSIQQQISTSGPHYVTATKPVMAATVVMSQNGGGALIKADPAMTLIIPEEQYAQTYTIATATWSGAAIDGNAYNNFLTVVIRRDRIDSVVLDGVNVNIAYPDTVWEDIPATAVGGKPALVTTYFNITSGTHTISTLQDDTQFMCIVYGAGDRESYAYMGGMRLQVINPACTQVLQTTFGDGVDNDCDARIDEEFCDGEDDDNDGSIDEDCVVRNAVVPRGDITVFVGEPATLKWTVYATDFTGFNGLKLYKQQPTAAEVLMAEGSGNLVLDQLFSEPGKYSVKVSNPVRKGELFVVEVEMTVAGARTVDPGDYRLEYTAQNGAFDGVNKLSVQQRNQQYEIIARDLETGATQTARSSQPQPRNLFFQEGKNYSLTFHSIGGQHLDDLPYRQFFDNVEGTVDFEVIGLKENYVTGSTTGLQDVKTVYELVNPHWTAMASYDNQVLSVKNANGTVVDDALLHVESIVRPSINCIFEMNADDITGHVTCNITDVKVPIDQVYWEFDGDVVLPSPSNSAPYTVVHAAHTTPETYIAVLDGIKADQWPSNSDTRVFRITFNQTNGYTLSAETPVTLSEFPATPVEIQCRAVVGGGTGSPSTITCTNVGGNAAIDSVRWAANTGGDNTLVNGGSSSGVYTAGNLSEVSTAPYEYSADLIVSRPIIGSEQYQVIFVRNGVEETANITLAGRAATPGVVQGTVVTDSQTGGVSIPAEVVGGIPPPTTYIWTVEQPGGTFQTYSAGEGDSTNVTRNTNGNPSTTLNVIGDSTITRTFTLNASSVIGDQVVWHSSRSWVIQPPVIPIVPGVVTGSVVDPNDGTLILVATVTGGSPAADTFNWTLPNGDILLPGQTSGSFVASPAIDNGDGSVSFNLTLNDGYTTNPQTIVFTAAAGNSWSGTANYNLSAKSVPATIVGSHEIGNSGATVYMTVTGGSPALNGHQWSFDIGGQRTNLTSGNTIGPYTANPPRDLGNGSVQYSLTLRDITELPKDFTFTATSVDSSNGAVFWTSSAIQRVNTLAVPPIVTCGLRTNDIRLGDEIEIVCTVNPTPVPGVTNVINDLIYTNILADGSERNISSTVTQPGFRYSQQANPDDTTDSSLFFTFPADFSDFKNYRFIVDYDGGVIVTPISLDPILTDRANRTVQYVTAVESSMVTLTCRAQSDGSLSFDSLMWKRRSLGPSGLVQSVYENQQIQEPFKGTGRYIQTNEVTPDGLLKSTLKITNLQRTDIAEYSCVWNQNTGGDFILDVIGTSFLVDGQQFNGQLTPLNDNQIYTNTFEFESYHITDYGVKYAGVPGSNFVTTVRNGSRYDSFAQESVPVIVYTMVDDSFSPINTFVIESSYKDDMSSTPLEEKRIEVYVLTKNTDSSSSGDGPRFITILVNNQKFGKDENVTLTSLLPVTLTIKVDASSCDQEFRVIIGAEDRTSEFTRTTELNGTRCIVSFTKPNYIGDADNTKTIQTVAVNPTGNLILSENPIDVTSVTTSSTQPPTIVKTDSCSDRNGGCHHTCVTDSPTEFHCECFPGFTLSADGRICTDNNECLVNNGGCDYICNNTEGSFTCSCPVGLRLSANGQSCIDDNECEGNPCAATEKCVNTFGSYHCISACECNCCDAPTAVPTATTTAAPIQGRKKRSLDASFEEPAKEIHDNTNALPFSIATLAWLLALTLLNAVTFYFAIRGRRVVASHDEKMLM